MKKMTLLAGALLAAAATAGAEARIQWVDPVCDFGAIAEADGVAERQLQFVNTGDVPVSVTGVRTSCGCTTASVPLDPVNPGDTAPIIVQYDPTSRPGKFEKKVTVTFSDDVPRASLRVCGVVIGTAKTLQTRYPVDAGEMRLHASLVPFGDVKKGSAKSDFLEVYNASHDTITPVWSSLPDYVTVAPAETCVPPGQQAVYNLMFSGYRCPLYGLVTDSAYIAASPDAKPVRIDLVGVVTEDFSQLKPDDLDKAPVAALSDDRIDFGTFDPKSMLTRTFTITNKGKNPFLVRRVYTVDKGIEVSVDKDKIKKGAHATVTVKVDPSALDSGILNGRVTVITNDPERSNITVRAVGLPSDF